MDKEIKKGNVAPVTNSDDSDKYPGVDINKGDKDKVNPKLVKQWTEELNNNPRNNKG